MTAPPGATVEPELNQPRFPTILHNTLSLIAILFGAVTLFAALRVLTGADPGYVVFLPLLKYNTLMGFVYVGVGVIAWRNLHWGGVAAGVVFGLNLLVLAAIVLVYQSGGGVAVDSVQAMSLRTVVWLVIFAGLWWLDRRASGAGTEER